MNQTTDRLPGILTIHGDTSTFGCSPKEHDKHLIHLVNVATKNALVFINNKCKIRHPKIIFYSAIFTAKGIHLYSIKFQALQDLPTPDNQTSIIPRPHQLPITVHPPTYPTRPTSSGNSSLNGTGNLHQLDWKISTNALFQCLKSWICSNLLRTTLTYYNRTKPEIIQTNASDYGLGAASCKMGTPSLLPTKP